MILIYISSSQPTSLLEILATELLSIMKSQMMWLFSPKSHIHSIIIKSIASFPLNVFFHFARNEIVIKANPKYIRQPAFSRITPPSETGQLKRTVACLYDSFINFTKEESTMSSMEYFLNGTAISLNLFVLAGVHHLILLCIFVDLYTSLIYF